MYRQTAKKRRAQERRNFNTVDYDGNNSSSPYYSTAYPFRLNSYATPPLFEITLDQFEQWAIDRMKVLGEIESRLARNQTLTELETALKPLINELLPLNSNRLQQRDGNGGLTVEIKNGKTFKFDENNEEHRRLKDHYSHFILRLAFCRSEELRQRFIRAETALFKIRYNTDDPKDRAMFVKSLDLDWEPVSNEEILELQDKLIAASGAKSLNDANNVMQEPGQSSYFKVDFERVADLVENRRVFLRRGKAYVPISYQQSMVVADFSANLEKALIQTVRALPRLDEDDRLVPLLNHLAQGFSATSKYLQDEAAAGREGEITASMVDKLVDPHFPLCMKTMHNALVSNHHLKYEARRQYGLFLKWIGLDVEEAVKFWRTHFSNITDDKFTKEYRYNIRHQYGLEGGRINYKPMSCIDIANGPRPARGDSHGCPYRSFSTENLVTALQKMGITDKQELTTIKNNVDSHHYHVACTRVYELTHRQDKTVYVDSITHPNQYFDRSYAAMKQSLENGASN